MMTMATVRQMMKSTKTVMGVQRMVTTTTMAKMARATAQWTTMDAWMIEDWTLVTTANLLPRVGKRRDGCNKTKLEEEETVTDLVVIHTTIEQITGRGEW